MFATESERIDRLVKGNAGVSAPATAHEGETFLVYLRVSAEKLEPLLQGLHADHPENTTLRGERNVKLTPRMVATVEGFGFDILPKEAQIQAVGSSETTWQWQVKPTESGVKTLTFRLAGTLTVEGREVGHDFYHHEQKVQVAVSPAGVFKAYWQWIVTTLALPALAAAWGRWRPQPDTPGGRRPLVLSALRGRVRIPRRTPAR